MGLLLACKRRKSDTLEAAVSSGLAFLEERKVQKTRKQKASHFRLVKAGSIRQTHTPYRARVNAHEGML